MEEYTSMLPNTEKLDAKGEEQPKLHVFITPEELTFLTEAEYKERTQPDDPGADNTSFVQDQIHISQQVTKPLVPVKQRSSKTWLIAPAITLLINIAIVLFIFFADILPVLTQQATITIIPKSATFTAQVTLRNIQSRIFSPLTLSKTKTVETTGHGHQDAQQASGFITFYNAAPQEQTIAAGTLLTGADGIQVVTDQNVYLPGSQPPVETQVTVSAHAVNPGTQGNIKAGDISGSCCRINILVSNNTFSGGQDERNFKIVTKADIQGVVSSLVPTLTSTMHTSLVKLVRPHETLVEQTCSQHIGIDHQVGEEATTVTITVQKSCEAGAYSTDSYTSQVMNALSQQAGKGYSVSAYAPVSPIQTKIADGRIILAARYKATVVYQFTPQQQQHLIHNVAGKNTKQALKLLFSQPGIQTVSISGIDKNASLPKDFTHIHILILYFPTA